MQTEIKRVSPAGEGRTNESPESLARHSEDPFHRQRAARTTCGERVDDGEQELPAYPTHADGRTVKLSANTAALNMKERRKLSYQRRPQRDDRAEWKPG